MPLSISKPEGEAAKEVMCSIWHHRIFNAVPGFKPRTKSAGMAVLLAYVVLLISKQQDNVRVTLHFLHVMF